MTMESTNEAMECWNRWLVELRDDKISNSVLECFQLPVKQLQAIANDMLLQRVSALSFSEQELRTVMYVYGSLMFERCKQLGQLRSKIFCTGSGFSDLIDCARDSHLCIAFIKCIRNALMSDGLADCPVEQQWCAHALLSVLTTSLSHAGYESDFVHCLQLALRCLCDLFYIPTFRVTPDLADKLLVFLQSHICVGLPGYTFVNASMLSVTPPPGLTLDGDSPSRKLQVQRKMPRRCKRELAKGGSGSSRHNSTSAEKTPNSSLPTSSDSELEMTSGSDTETSASSTSSYVFSQPFHNTPTSCRNLILHLLQILVESIPCSNLRAHWLRFFPDAQPSYFSTQSSLTSSLTRLIMIERMDKLRSNALAITNLWASRVKTYLIMAERNVVGRRVPAFTPLSLVLHGSLSELHRTILLCFTAEKNAMLFKCLAGLINVTPYDKCDPQLLLSTIAAVKDAHQMREANIRVACVNCLCAFVCSHTVSDAVLDVQLMQSVDSDSMGWLWYWCQQLAAPTSNEPLPVRLEALHTIASLVTKRKHYARPQLAATCAWITDFDTDNPDVVLHCVRLANAFLTAIIRQKPNVSSSMTLDAERTIVDANQDQEEEDLDGPMEAQEDGMPSAGVNRELMDDWMKLAVLPQWQFAVNADRTIQLWPSIAIEMCSFVSETPGQIFTDPDLLSAIQWWPAIQSSWLSKVIIV